jgi:hypothetical protein
MTSPNRCDGRSEDRTRVEEEASGGPGLYRLTIDLKDLSVIGLDWSAHGPIARIG